MINWSRFRTRLNTYEMLEDNPFWNYVFKIDKTMINWKKNENELLPFINSKIKPWMLHYDFKVL